MSNDPRFAFRCRECHHFGTDMAGTCIHCGEPVWPIDIYVIGARVAEYVAEIPDRTSPSDFPDAMLVTASELIDAVAAAFDGVPTPEPPPPCVKDSPYLELKDGAWVPVRCPWNLPCPVHDKAARYQLAGKGRA